MLAWHAEPDPAQRHAAAVQRGKAARYGLPRAGRLQPPRLSATRLLERLAGGPCCRMLLTRQLLSLYVCSRCRCLLVPSRATPPSECRHLSVRLGSRAWSVGGYGAQQMSEDAAAGAEGTAAACPVTSHCCQLAVRSAQPSDPEQVRTRWWRHWDRNTTPGLNAPCQCDGMHCTPRINSSGCDVTGRHASMHRPRTWSSQQRQHSAAAAAGSQAGRRRTALPVRCASVHRCHPIASAAATQYCLHARRQLGCSCWRPLDRHGWPEGVKHDLQLRYSQAPALPLLLTITAATSPAVAFSAPCCSAPAVVAGLPPWRATRAEDQAMHLASSLLYTCSSRRACRHPPTRRRQRGKAEGAGNSAPFPPRPLALLRQAVFRFIYGYVNVVRIN